MPDSLLGRAFVIEGDVETDIADAETAMTRLSVEAASLVNTKFLAHILLRAEAARDLLEHQLASPEVDTSRSEPVRHVPRRQ